MPRKSLDDRLAELTRQRDQLEARRLALLAEKKGADRKAETRRKIIVGAAILAQAELTPGFAEQLRELLDTAVTRPVDRAAIADLLPSPAPPERIREGEPPVVDEAEAAA